MLVEIGIPRDIGARLADFSEVDAELYDLITNVPKVATPWNVLLALLNVFFPGIGTILCSIWGEPCSKSQVLVGLIQFSLTSYLAFGMTKYSFGMVFTLFGWLWSVWWSVLILKKSCSSAEMVKYYSKAQEGGKNLMNMIGDDGQPMKAQRMN